MTPTLPLSIFMPSPTAALPVPPTGLSSLRLAGRDVLSLPFTFKDLNMLRMQGKPIAFDEFVDVDLGSTASIVDPIIPAGGVVLCHGKRGHGKTQFATTLALAIGQGELFGGRYPTTKGKIVLVQADNPMKSQQIRLRRIPRNPNLYLSGFDTTLDVMTVRPGDSWVRALRDLDPILVIVDSLRKTHRANENDAATPSLVYGQWRELLGAEPTLFFLHHDRKTYLGPGGDDADPTEAFRGSGAWLDDCDTGIHIVQGQNPKANNGKKITAYFSKLRDCEEQEPMVFHMNKETLLLERYGNPSAKEMAYQFRHDNPDMPKAELVKYIMEDMKVSRTQAYRIVDELFGTQS